MSRLKKSIGMAPLPKFAKNTKRCLAACFLQIVILDFEANPFVGLIMGVA